MSPFYSFMVFLVCIFLVWKLNLITVTFSILLTLFLTLFFYWWIIDTQAALDNAAKVNSNYEFKTFDFILLDGSLYDVITLFIINFLLFWQISILLRMLIKTSQKENVLP